jgi:hypothetical protein
MTKKQQHKMTNTTSSKQLRNMPNNSPFDSTLSLLENTTLKKSHKPYQPQCRFRHFHRINTSSLKAQKSTTRTPYSPNALITSNRIPAKADLQSASQAALRLRAPLLFPAYFRRSRIFESAPAVFRQLVEDV